MAEHPPTNQELADSIEQLFETAHGSAIFEYWSMVNRPLLRELKANNIEDAGDLFSKALHENSLLLIRKTAEFFKEKKKDDKNDTLYAYRYLSNWKSNPVVSKNEYRELHKRVGHITIRETRYGQLPWQIQSMIIQSIKAWLDFFEKVGASPVFGDNPPTERLQGYVETLHDILKICVKRQTVSTKS